MSTNTTSAARRELRSIRYINRTYTELKTELTNLIQQYFPNSWQDFSEGSAGQALLEINAHIGDILNFYIDHQFNEMFIDRAVETKNIYSLAKGLGYYPSSVRPSVGEMNISFDLPAIDSTTSQMFFVVQKGSAFRSNGSPSVTFQNTEPILFDGNIYSSGDNISIMTVKGTQITRMTRSQIKIVSGNTKTFTVQIGEVQNFRRIIIPERSITEVISVLDSNGQEWNQVKSLAQEFIYTGVQNTTSSSAATPYLMTVKRVPYRFVFEQLPNGTSQLTFGSGDLNTNDEEFVIGPEDYIAQNQITGKFSDFNPEDIAVDDFLNTNALGVAPANITMTITYRVGGGLTDNVASNTISDIDTLNIDYYNSSLNSTTKNSIRSSILFANPLPTQGARDSETTDQIRINASYNYAAQDRVVSLPDFAARASTMPTQFGSIYKVYAKKAFDNTLTILESIKNEVISLTDFNLSTFNSLANNGQLPAGYTEAQRNTIINLIDDLEENNAANVNLYVISMDGNGNLQLATSSLKRNLLVYLSRFKMISDTIAIKDVDIINLGCMFEIQVNNNNYNAAEIHSNCLDSMQTYLQLDNMEIGKPIIVTDVIRMLQEIQGVISVPNVTFYVLSGQYDSRSYSTTVTTTIEQLLDYGGAVISCPNNCLFEFRYPTIDIIGRATI